MRSASLESSSSTTLEPGTPLTSRITSPADNPCTSTPLTLMSKSPGCILPEQAALPLGASVESMCLPPPVVSNENPTPESPSGGNGIPGKGPRSNSTVLRVHPAGGLLDPDVATAAPDVATAAAADPTPAQYPQLLSKIKGENRGVGGRAQNRWRQNLSP